MVTVELVLVGVVVLTFVCQVRGSGRGCAAGGEAAERRGPRRRSRRLELVEKVITRAFRGHFWGSVRRTSRVPHGVTTSVESPDVGLRTGVTRRPLWAP